MPMAAKRPCTQVGCRALVSGGGRCELHRKEKTRQQTQADKQNPQRMESKRLYATPRWQRLRRCVLRRNPLCVTCKAAGRLVPAEHVDHIEPHGGNVDVFFDETNLQGLCKPCHSRKTALEDGGFGRPKTGSKAA